MRKPIVLFLFCLITSFVFGGDANPPADTQTPVVQVQATAEKELKARAERAELMAAYWQAIAERNEMAVRLLQTELRMAEANKKLEALEKKSP